MDKRKSKNMETDNTFLPEIKPENKDIISFFDTDEEFVFIYKKTEKLATAIYMVSNLFSDSEPIKWTLRKKVQETLSFVLNYRDSVWSDHKNFTDNFKSRVLELTSLLEISSHAGLLSFMNYSILNQEFGSLINRVLNSNADNKELVRGNLSKSFFFVAEPQSGLKNQSTTSLLQEKKETSLSDKVSNFSDVFIKDRSIFKRTNRQESILNLLRKKKDLTVKDIAAVVKGCSEKTIQRELILLISSGTIKKTGERRWTKYSLN